MYDYLNSSMYAASFEPDMYPEEVYRVSDEEVYIKQVYDNFDMIEAVRKSEVEDYCNELRSETDGEHFTFYIYEMNEYYDFDEWGIEEVYDTEVGDEIYSERVQK